MTLHFDWPWASSRPSSDLKFKLCTVDQKLHREHHSRSDARFDDIARGEQRQRASRIEYARSLSVTVIGVNECVIISVIIYYIFLHINNYQTILGEFLN